MFFGNRLSYFREQKIDMNFFFIVIAQLTFKLILYYILSSLRIMHFFIFVCMLCVSVWWYSHFYWISVKRPSTVCEMRWDVIINICLRAFFFTFIIIIIWTLIPRWRVAANLGTNRIFDNFKLEQIGWKRFPSPSQLTTNATSSHIAPGLCRA